MKEDEPVKHSAATKKDVPKSASKNPSATPATKKAEEAKPEHAKPVVNQPPKAKEEPKEDEEEEDSTEEEDEEDTRDNEEEKLKI